MISKTFSCLAAIHAVTNLVFYRGFLRFSPF
jgi:hypothetical protein